MESVSLVTPRAGAAAIVSLGLATVCALWSDPATASQRPKLEQSVDLQVPVAPVVLDVGGTPHLVHELHITNMRRQPIELRRVQVLAHRAGQKDDERVPMADLEGASLARTLQRIGLPRDAPDPHLVLPGQRTVSFFWTALPPAASPPSRVSHRMTLFVSDGGTTVLEVEGAVAAVSSAPIEALDPPLSGGPWVAIYNPLLMGGHRTAIYTLDGKARIPARFAIDWIRPPGAGPASGGGADDGGSRNGFSADVLAVADARVASAIDDMPDNPPDSTAPSPPLPIEQGSGNYIALDLGRGRFAFYEHLRHRSILVKVGERVRAGQVIAQLGSSGSTSIGPHLHFHVADTNLTLAAEGLPFVFRRFEHRGAYRSLDAMRAGEPWLAAPAEEAGVRRLQHPLPVSVVHF